FPSILLVPILLSLVTHASTWFVALVLALVRVLDSTRVARADAARYLSSDGYVAIHALGASPFRVFFLHMLPSSIGGWAGLVAANVGVLSGIEAAVAFLGFDATAATAATAVSWGAQLGQAARSGDVGGGMVAGVALSVVVATAFYVAGALRARYLRG
ncbi:MAG: ABC transporter permease subunit, partial [Polyangiaceae bacterium]|nr:ABC transporter permease subunit [Polyangiaceae bacterium]